MRMELYEAARDPTINVNCQNTYGFTPLRVACNGGHDVVEWWIASGREMDLGTPGDTFKTDALGGAKLRGSSEVVTLLERFKENRY